MNAKNILREGGDLPDSSAEAAAPLAFPERERTREQALAAAQLEQAESDRKFIETLLDDPVDGYEAWVDFLSTNVLSLENLKKDDAPLPTREEAVAFLLEKLNPEQMRIARDPRYVSKPKFLLVPMTSKERLLPKIGKKRHRDDIRQLGETAFSVDEWSDKRMERVDQCEMGSDEGPIMGWQLGIAESAEASKILPDEPMHYALESRVFWFQNHYSAHGVRRIGYRAYALLAAQAAEAGSPIDNQCHDKPGGTSTLLDDYGVSSFPYVDAASYKTEFLDQNAVYFEGYYERDRNDSARQRVALMVEKFNYSPASPRSQIALLPGSF